MKLVSSLFPHTALRNLLSYGSMKKDNHPLYCITHTILIFKLIIYLFLNSVTMSSGWPKIHKDPCTSARNNSFSSLHFLNPFMHWQTLGLMLTFATVNNAAMSMDTSIFHQVHSFNVGCSLHRYTTPRWYETYIF